MDASDPVAVITTPSQDLEDRRRIPKRKKVDEPHVINPISEEVMRNGPGHGHVQPPPKKSQRKGNKPRGGHREVTPRNFGK